MPRRRVIKALTKTQKRKKEHLEICLDTESVTSASGTGLNRYRFVHNALPELDIDEIDLSTTFLGKRLQAPILISSMTGGFDLARKGNRNFKGLGEKIAAVCRELEVPVIAKEVGNGISVDAAIRLQRAGVKALDVAGYGGTSWSAVEAQRAVKQGKRPDTAFADWGIPTEEALVSVRQALPDIQLIASGGIRSGVDIAKAIALGADLGAFGQPLLAAALESSAKVVEFIAAVIHKLKVSMLCIGAANLTALRKAPLVHQS